MTTRIFRACLGMLVVSTCLLAGCATPNDGGRSLLGGVEQKQLGEHSYRITASVNGFTPSAAVKPMVLRKASEIGKQLGYTGFELRDVALRYDAPGEGYTARVDIHYFRQKAVPIRGISYVLGSEEANLYRPDFAESNAKGLAKLQFTAALAGVKWVAPAFVDAVGAQKNTWNGRDAAYLRPGRQPVTLFAFYGTFWQGPFGTFVQVAPDLAPDTVYNLSGSFEQNVLKVWIEDAVTKEVVPGSTFEMTR